MMKLNILNYLDTRFHEKIRPGQAQMICASFSPGGVFFCVGSVDHNVRVYKMDCPGVNVIKLFSFITDDKAQ